ncbi:polysulfide reductase NrfD [Natronosporangium hydrolyticum]|uniref:Polysulfide reductase NrfD n=1 Tax=Natronosporangium hydrolyticum TaxID=2811111 RepID=A0A895YBQ0_9ACTN|nr:NrfD/PsrC family molybdoenzyme membrane anchor subunit [Natronosporangium hydrolyticum]QSB12749.1 polysulfide reductase NrfD [Natronosporangium hydrolyticum]
MTAAGSGRRGDPAATVPEAEFRSYYGQPIIKAPTWKTPDVPLYLLFGGTAGATAVMAVLAEATGRQRLARAGAVAAAATAASGTIALIHDLGRPARFLYMLRVARPTSPLSMGSWLLAAFGTLSGVAGTTAVTGWFPRLGRAAGWAAGLLGPAMMTYPAVLFADTAVPAWHEAYRELPFLFAGSALASGAGVGLLAAPTGESAPARRLAVAGAALEFAAERRLEGRLGALAEPYRQGAAGRWLRAGRALSVAGALGALAGRRSRVAAAVSGAALLAGAFCVRFGVFEAGRASARDPRYTVVPQRARLAARNGDGKLGEAKLGGAKFGGAKEE